jgi:hypothetical protein
MAGINRTFVHTASGLELLVMVYFETDVPKVHVALRNPTDTTWGPPLGEVSNQDQPTERNQQ